MQNRARVRIAAGELLAATGLSASVADIAAQAGVSKGTVLRHWATKEELVAEVTLETLDDLLERGTGFLVAADPSSALQDFMVEVLRLQERDQAFCDVVNQTAHNSPAVAAAIVQIGTVVNELTDRAKAVHSVRQDLTGDDVVALTNGIHHASRPLVGREPEPWRRYLTVVLQGMRS